MFKLIFKEKTPSIIAEKGFLFSKTQEHFVSWAQQLHFSFRADECWDLSVKEVCGQLQNHRGQKWNIRLYCLLKEKAWQLWVFDYPPHAHTHKLLLQEVGGAFGSSLTFLWTKYIKSLLLRRLKSCNNGRWQGQKGPKCMLHQPKAVRQFCLHTAVVSSHCACKMLTMLLLSFTSGQQNGSVLSQSPSFLSWRIYRDLHVSVGRRCAHTVCLWGIIAINCALPSYFLGGLWVQRPCLITDSGCRWLKAGARQRKKEKMKRGKKEEAPGLPVVAVWGCSHYD